MYRLYSSKLALYFTPLLASFILFSCSYKQDFITEEVVALQLNDVQKETQKDSVIALVKDLNKEGTTARNMADYKEALNLHFRALNLAEIAKDTLGQILALNNIGTDLRRTYSNIEASTYHYLALELSGNNNKYLKMRSMAMNGLGNIFLALNKSKQAESYFKQALSIECELNNILGQAINYANLAETYSINNDLDSALYYYDKSLEQNNIIDSDIGKAICKRAMGLIYYEKGDERQALQLLDEAFALMKDSKDAFHKLEVQISLAETYINIGRTSEAEPHVMEILSQAKAINSFDYQHRSYNLLANLKERQELLDRKSVV